MQVFECLNELEVKHEGVLRFEKEDWYGGGKHRPNEFTIMIPCPPNANPSVWAFDEENDNADSGIYVKIDDVEIRFFYPEAVVKLDEDEPDPPFLYITNKTRAPFAGELRL